MPKTPTFIKIWNQSTGEEYDISGASLYDHIHQLNQANEAGYKKNLKKYIADLAEYERKEADEEINQEIEQLKAVINGYESGRFIRFMHWLHKHRRRESASV